MRIGRLYDAGLSTATPSFGVGTFSVVPRRAVVNVSIEVADDASMEADCCIATSELGFNGARSLSIEFCNSVRRVGSGRSLRNSLSNFSTRFSRLRGLRGPALAVVGLRWGSWACVGCDGPVLACVGLLDLGLDT